MNQENNMQKENIEIIAGAILVDPVEAFGASFERMHSLDKDALEAIQLSALKTRFRQLRDNVPMLKKLADEQNADDISALDDVVPLLFRHTIYKSYPIALLEQGRFMQMTQWLNKLTTHDLSGLDVSKCEGIDDWGRVLDKDTPLNLRSSSGTTGTVSFIPRSKKEAEKHFLSAMFGIFSSRGLPPPRRDAPLSMHAIHGSYRSGFTAYLRYPDMIVKYICNGDEAKFHSLYPGHQSADVSFLAGRLRAAQMKGELDRLELSPAMLARKAEFEAMHNNAERDSATFYANITENLKGERVFANAPWSAAYNVAKAGLESGAEAVFSPDSILAVAGGPKGHVLAPDWEEQVKRYFGVPRLVHQYGMSEVMGNHKLCDHNRYHIEPWAIFFVLDPDTGAPLPREGVKTGRAAFYDLQAETYWGGFVSGDEVTVDWSTPCPCGQLSPHIAASIMRYSDKQGGDDKISCAAALEAHEAALDYLVDEAV